MLYLGEPPFSDTDAAAKLLLRYRREGGLTPDAAHMFLMMVEHPLAVLRRTDELEAEEQPPAAS